MRFFNLSHMEAAKCQRDDLNTINHLNLKLLIFVGTLQVLNFEFLKFRILKILNFQPCV